MWLNGKTSKQKHVMMTICNPGDRFCVRGIITSKTVIYFSQSKNVAQIIIIALGAIYFQEFLCHIIVT